MTLQEIKLSIWVHRKINRSPVAVQTYADRAKVVNNRESIIFVSPIRLYGVETVKTNFHNG